MNTSTTNQVLANVGEITEQTTNEKLSKVAGIASPTTNQELPNVGEKTIALTDDKSWKVVKKMIMTTDADSQKVAKDAICATIRALCNYDSMKFIISDTPRKIREIEDTAAAVHSPVIDGMPKIYNYNAHEEKLLHAIEITDVYARRYYSAIKFMKWFEPAWQHLSEDERYILHEFYMTGAQEKSIAVYTIMNNFSIERSSAYNKKNRAVQHLATLLFGVMI